MEKLTNSYNCWSKIKKNKNCLHKNEWTIEDGYVYDFAWNSASALVLSFFPPQI